MKRKALAHMAAAKEEEARVALQQEMAQASFEAAVEREKMAELQVRGLVMRAIDMWMEAGRNPSLAVSSCT